MISHFGNWNPNGFSNFQKAIARVKTHWIEDFLISLESSQQGLKLCLRSHLNQRLAEEVKGFQSCKSPNFKNFGTMHKEYYKGEGGGFLQIQAVVSLVSLCLPVVRPCTKSASIMHQPTCLICACPCE